MACRTGCDTKNHRSWAECARDIQIGNLDASQQKRWDSELDTYRSARAQGIQPAGSKRYQTEAAVEMSQRTGTAFQSI